MENLVKNDAELVKYTEEESFEKNFKAMFYYMNAKQDSSTKIFKNKIKVTLEDIYDLNHRVLEKLKQQPLKELIVSTNINFENRKSIRFGSWTEFRNYDFKTSNTIRSITITWDYACCFPGLTIPQKHSLMVKLTNGITPEEMLNIIFSGNVENIEEMDKDTYPVVARVDFIDRLLADELLNIVGDWVQILKTVDSDKNKFILSMKHHRKIIGYALNYVITILTSILLLLLFNRFINSLNIINIAEMTKQQLNLLINNAVIFIFIGVGLHKFYILKANSVFRKLSEYGESHIFNITSGDKNKQAVLKKREVEREKKIFYNMGINILLNIICGIISSILFNKM